MIIKMLKYFKWRYAGFLLLGYFYFKVDWKQIGVVMQIPDPLPLLGCLALIPPQVLIKSERWRFLLRLQGHSLKALDSFLIYMSATLFGSITPGRAGELAKVVYLKNHGMTVSRAFSSVVVDRVFDLYFLERGEKIWLQEEELLRAELQEGQLREGQLQLREGQRDEQLREGGDKFLFL